MINYKHLFISMILLVLSLALAGCGGTSADTSSAPTPAASGAFKVALLLPGPVDGEGWNNVGIQGITALENELGVQVSYTENVPEADYEKVFRQYAEEDFDFIVGHGNQFVAAAEVVAEEFPRTKFGVIGNYGGNNKNLGALAFRAGEMGYLFGEIAALKTETNKVAYIGGQDLPVLQEIVTLFERTARANNPDIEISTHWIGNWYDPDKAGQIAQELIEAEVDVLVVNAGGSDATIFEAAENAGIYVIGSGVDYHEAAPNTILTSAVLDVPTVLLEGVTLAQRGQWEGRQYTFGLREGAQDLAPFYGLLTAEEEEMVEAVKNDILARKIDVAP